MQSELIQSAERYSQLLKDQNELLRRHNLLLNELTQLKKLIFGPKRERFISEVNTHQLSLFGAEESVMESDAIDEKQHISYDRKVAKRHPGRTELPDHLPIEEVIIEPEEDTTGMKRIGEEITDTLEYTPASLIRKRTIRPKYAKLDGEGVVIGKL